MKTLLIQEIVKAFNTVSEAEEFVKYGLQGSSKGRDPKKYYGVRVGKVPGVYTDWPTANQQVIGFKGPKYKSFPTRQEAELFVKGDGPSENEEGGKAALKSKKPKNGIQAPELDEIDDGIEPGYGPLPKGAVDGFDPRIKLNSSTGVLEYKSQDRLHATKMMATGVVKNEPLHIFTDGSSLKNGAVGAKAGVGVYFGPQDSRYADHFHLTIDVTVRLKDRVGTCQSH